MSDVLDEKLKAIEVDRQALESISWGYVRLDDTAIEEIKQAFIDAGWLRTVDISVPPSTVYSKPALLSGQEWYWRFEDQLGLCIFPTWYERNKPEEQHEVLDRKTVLKVAREAAGLSKGE